MNQMPSFQHFAELLSPKYVVVCSTLGGWKVCIAFREEISSGLVNLRPFEEVEFQSLKVTKGLKRQRNEQGILTDLRRFV